MAIPSKEKGAGHGGLGGTADEYANGGSRSPVPASSRCCGGLRRQATVQTDA
jgi:hypothetical protein